MEDQDQPVEPQPAENEHPVSEPEKGETGSPLSPEASSPEAHQTEAGIAESSTDVQEALTAESPPLVEEEEPAAEVEPEPEEAAEPGSPGRGRLRTGIRWALILLVVFALGMMAFALAFYLPAVRTSQRMAEDLNNEKAALESRVSELKIQVEELETQVDSLSGQLTTAEEENQALEETLQTAVLHRLILSALADVNAARLALETGDVDGARLALAKTPGTVDDLSELVLPEHQESVQAMAARLELALLVIESDSPAAASDLEVLATNLARLEKAYFVEP